MCPAPDRRQRHTGRRPVEPSPSASMSRRRRGDLRGRTLMARFNDWIAKGTCSAASPQPKSQNRNYGFALGQYGESTLKDANPCEALHTCFSGVFCAYSPRICRLFGEAPATNHTRDVTGSNPVSPTSPLRQQRSRSVQVCPSPRFQAGNAVCPSRRCRCSTWAKMGHWRLADGCESQDRPRNTAF